MSRIISAIAQPSITSLLAIALLVILGFFLRPISAHNFEANIEFNMSVAPRLVKVCEVQRSPEGNRTGIVAYHMSTGDCYDADGADTIECCLQKDQILVLVSGWPERRTKEDKDRRPHPFVVTEELARRHGFAIPPAAKSAQTTY